MKFNRNISFKGLLLAGLVFGFSGAGVAEPAMPPMSPDLKHDMAHMYAKMGECMKTDKTMEQCQTEVMKDCQVMKKTKHCPIMEGMQPMMGSEKMQGQMKGMGTGNSTMGNEKMQGEMKGMDMGNSKQP